MKPLTAFLVEGGSETYVAQEVPTDSPRPTWKWCSEWWGCLRNLWSAGDVASGLGAGGPRSPGVRAEMTGLSVPQLRREARLRREYLYRKAREEAQRSAQERKEKVRRALEGTAPAPLRLQASL